jgi:hypothetical protein
VREERRGCKRMKGRVQGRHGKGRRKEKRR